MRKRWTQEEMDYLEDMISSRTAAQIARDLGRTFNSVNLKLGRMGLRGFKESTDLLTMNQLCKLMQVDYRTVTGRWRRRGLQIGKRGSILTVRQDELLRFLKRNPDLWNAAKFTDDTLVRGKDWYQQKLESDRKEYRAYFWSDIEVSRMKALRHMGYSIREIGEKLGRSESSIKYKLYGGK